MDPGHRARRRGRTRRSTKSIRNVAYALLSGADGWMFDGEDALGQVSTMSLDNQRNLKLAIHRDPMFLQRRRAGRRRDEPVGARLLRPADRRRLAAAARLHDEDLPRRAACTSTTATSATPTARGFSASIVDAALYVVNNHERLRDAGASLVLYLPKIQTAEEAALWNDILRALEAAPRPAGRHDQGLRAGRADRGVLPADGDPRRARRRTSSASTPAAGTTSTASRTRWPGIPTFVNPNIDAITMTYGYMRHYEDRVRRAVNTPDRDGQFALWQGGMEPNIPVGSAAGVASGMERAVAGAEREQREGASGKWVAHWKMVHIVRPVWEKAGAGQSARPRVSAARPTRAADADGLTLLEPAPRTVRGARDLLSVALQYGNAFGQGMQAAALKPADFFGNDDVLYLMEDMATGEIRLSILWEWLHKPRAHWPRTSWRPRAWQTRQRSEGGDVFTRELFLRLLAEEYAKLQAASNRDVHDDSKSTTLPIAREIVEAYVTRRREAAVVHRSAEHDARHARPRHRAARIGRLARHSVPTGRASPRTWTLRAGVVES